MNFSQTWDGTLEASPANADDRGDGAAIIRKDKRDTRERLGVDHIVGSIAAGSETVPLSYTTDDTGCHRQVTLVESKHLAIDLPTSVNRIVNLSNTTRIAREGESSAAPSHIVVTSDEAQTLTNKTLTSPAINGGSGTSQTLVTPDIQSATFSSGAATSRTNLDVLSAAEVNNTRPMSIYTVSGAGVVSLTYEQSTACQATFSRIAAGQYRITMGTTGYYSIQAAAGSSGPFAFLFVDNIYNGTTVNVFAQTTGPIGIDLELVYTITRLA